MMMNDLLFGGLSLHSHYYTPSSSNIHSLSSPPTKSSSSRNLNSTIEFTRIDYNNVLKSPRK